MTNTMNREVNFYCTNTPDAETVAAGMESLMGITVIPLGDAKPDPYKVEERVLAIDPGAPFIVFNGDGYFHNSTLGIVKDLVCKRRANGLPEISYVHIDGHDDIAPPSPGNHESYKSFVLGIDEYNDGGIHILQEGLTGEKDGGFIVPDGPESWGSFRQDLRDPFAYLSIDLDVLDIEALQHGGGVHHLFPQSPTGFDSERLLAHVDMVSGMGRIIGADIVGFSSRGATKQNIVQSLGTIAAITERLVENL